MIDILAVDSTAGALDLEVASKRRSYFLRAPTKEVLNCWEMCFRAISKTSGDGTSTKKKRKGTGSTATNASAAAGPEDDM